MPLPHKMGFNVNKKPKRFKFNSLATDKGVMGALKMRAKRFTPSTITKPTKISDIPKKPILSPSPPDKFTQAIGEKSTARKIRRDDISAKQIMEARRNQLAKMESLNRNTLLKEQRKKRITI